MDKEFLEKYNLQEAVKRFQQINEYTFITSPVLSEDGEDDDMMQNQLQQDGQAPQQASMDGNGEQMPTRGGNNMSQNGDSSSQTMGEGSMNNEGVPPQTNGAPMDDSTTPQQMDDTPPMTNGEEADDEEDTLADGDEVVDVDDLTTSQEATEYKIDGVDDKLTRMLSVLDKFSAALEASDKKIDDLRQEFEKRNPSEQEKLNIRSQASYPYSETPKDYWDAKIAANPHYNVIYDNDVSTADEQKKFDITKDDLKDGNFKNIADSFDIDDMKLDDFLKF